MSMHGANGKGKRKQKGHLAFQVPFLHVLARSHENGTNGGLTVRIVFFRDNCATKCYKSLIITHLAILRDVKNY